MATNPVYLVIKDGVLLRVSSEYIKKQGGRFIVPDGVETIDSGAFLFCGKLIQQITVNSSVKNIEFSLIHCDRRDLEIILIAKDFFAKTPHIPPHLDKNMKLKYIPKEHYDNDNDKPGAYGDLENMVDNYIKGREKEKDENEKTKKYLRPSFFGLIGKSFTQKKQAADALNDALKGNNTDLISHLETIRNGSLGHELREFIKKGDANVIVSRNVTTVTEFINALQEKINAFYAVQINHPGPKTANR